VFVVACEAAKPRGPAIVATAANPLPGDGNHREVRQLHLVTFVLPGVWSFPVAGSSAPDLRKRRDRYPATWLNLWDQLDAQWTLCKINPIGGNTHGV
jgi:hypothetical protein